MPAGVSWEQLFGDLRRFFARLGNGLLRRYSAAMDWLVPERRKVDLRNAVDSSPIAAGYPFDPEAKMLRSIGVEGPMFDIGANAGDYSALFEDLVGPGNLYIFEPLPLLYHKLKRKFRQSQVFKLALSDREASENMRIPFIAGYPYDTRATLNQHLEPGQPGAQTVSANLSTLDSVVASLGLAKVGFLKIDVEGHELAVLKGARNVLRYFKPLILIEAEARHHSFPLSVIFEFIEGFGYAGYYLDPCRLELRKVKDFDCSRDQSLLRFQERDFFHYLNNFLFVDLAVERVFVLKATGFLEAEKSQRGLQADFGKSE